MRHSHRSALLAILGVSGLLLAACGPDVAGERPSARGSAGQSTAQPVAGEQDDEPVTLSLWYMPNGAEPESAMEAELDAFRAAHPDIQVEATLVGWEEALTKLATATQSGAGPDVTQLGSSWVAGLAETGAFRVWDEAEIDALGGRQAFVESSWASTADGDAATVAIPWLVDTRVLYYRTDVFADLELDPDVALADWESFEDTLARIEAETDLTPWGVPGRNDWNVVHNAVPWLWSAGGTILSDDGQRATLDSPETLTGLRTFQELVARYGHAGALASSDADSQQLFVDGEYAITMSGPWFMGFLRGVEGMPAYESWAVAPTPAGPAGRASFLGGSHLAVFDDTEHRQESEALVAFLTSRESMSRYSAAAGLLPAATSADVWDSEEVAGFAEALQSGRQYPSFPSWLEVETTLQRALSSMWEQVESTGEPLSHAEVSALLSRASSAIGTALERRDS